MGKQSLSFVRIWLIPDNPIDARGKLNNVPLELDQGGWVYFDPKTVWECGNTYLLSSLS